MKKISNDEISKLAEDYADYYVVINDKELWMKLRGAYRAGFFAALKILKTEQTTEAENSDEQPCFKHDVIKSVCECDITHDTCDCVDTGICEFCGKLIKQTVL